MKYMIMKWLPMLCLLLAAGFLIPSCSMMHQDLEDCPTGLYLSFKYDYNLQRADMFNDHVGAVTVYVYDADGRFVLRQEEMNREGYEPLKFPLYQMHLDLPEGSYQLLAVASQKGYEQTLEGGGADFVRSEPQKGDRLHDFCVLLDREPAEEGGYMIPNEGLPLDTLWHGMLVQEDGTTPKTVEIHSGQPVYETISLVRDTKSINVSLRELEHPEAMDIAAYDLKIYDRNSHIRWDNSLDETDEVVYTPYTVWNTDDRPADGSNAVAGRIGHADFMTSRILYHDRAADDAVLSVTHKETGREVIRIDLADMLSRLRGGADRYYEPQEFLDRGYDYQLTFFLQGGEWKYLELRISVLSWTLRIQNEDL